MAKKTKFNFISELHEKILTSVEVSKKGEVRLKKANLKAVLEQAMMEGAKRAASGERVRFPVIGALVRKEVKPRKAGKGKNPFTGEEITLKARPASKKPRWSFPKSLKETFANKKNW